MQRLKIPVPAKKLATLLEGIGISNGKVVLSHEGDFYHIDNDKNLQLIYNLDPDWGNIGFQLADEEGQDIYCGDNIEESYNKLVQYINRRKKIFGDFKQAQAKEKAKELWKKLDKISKARGEVGFVSLSEEEMKEVMVLGVKSVFL